MSGNLTAVGETFRVEEGTPMSCQKDHADRLPKSAISALHDSQAGFWRHKCAGCAYEMGRKDAGDAEERLRKRVQELTDHVDKLKAQLVGKIGAGV